MPIGPKRAAAAAALSVILLPVAGVTQAADSSGQAAQPAAPAAAVDATDDGGSGNTLDTVTVTGTHVRGRTVQDSASPIDIISNQDLQQTGQTNLIQALNALYPSLNLPAENDPDLGSMIRGAQLDGLDPSYTLVLINGKRRHTTAYVSGGIPGSVAVDLSLIPIAAIDHIEVLRDGASAIYGSDAIAGVVNIILKSNRTGGDDSVQWGKTYRGDGALGDFGLEQGLPLGEKGSIDLTLQGDKQQQAVRNFALKPGYLLYPAITPAGTEAKLGTNDALPAGDTPNPAEATRNDSPWQNQGQPASSDIESALNASLPIDDVFDPYAFGTFSHRVAFMAENFRTPDQLFVNDPSVLGVFPNGFTPYENIDEDDLQFNVGTRGAVTGWNYDLSTGLGKDEQNVYTRNTVNYSLTYPGPPTNFYDGAQIYYDWTSNLDVSRPFDVAFLAKPLQVAFGAEARRETDVVTPGEPLSYYGEGASSLIGNLPQNDVHAVRTSQSIYGEFSTNVTPRWFLDIAGRGEHYSDFGSTSTGKFATRFDFTDRVGLRATISNGFHAPALATESYTYKLDMNGTTAYTLVPSTASARALGATPLQPETSENYSLGVTFEPAQEVHAAVDAYIIDVNHRLGVSPTVGFNPLTGENSAGMVLTPEQIAFIENLLAKAGIPATGAVTASYYTAVGNTRTDGVDFTIDSAEHLGPGQFTWNFAANYNHNEMTSIASVPAALLGLPGLTTITQSAEYSLLYAAPTDKEILNLGYQFGGWALYVRENRYGELKRLNSLTDTPYFEDAIFTTDAGITHFFTRQLTLTIAATNAFNKYPETVPLAAQSASTRAQYVNAWDAASPVGLLGGQYFARIEYRH